MKIIFQKIFFWNKILPSLILKIFCYFYTSLPLKLLYKKLTYYEFYNSNLLKILNEMSPRIQTLRMVMNLHCVQTKVTVTCIKLLQGLTKILILTIFIVSYSFNKWLSSFLLFFIHSTIKSEYHYFSQVKMLRKFKA